MTINHPKFRAAAVQSASVLHDLDGGIEKAISIIEDAAKEDVQLLAFPEAWVPGYPYWAWLGPPAWGMQFVQAYHDNSMEVGSEQHQAICEAARHAKMHVVFGFSEKAGGSVYLAQSIIGADGQVIANRRKLRPTHVERSVYGDGDGSNLAVHDTELGKLGALCCWEHMQPLSKYAMYSMGEQVHVASWPTLSLYSGKAYALGPEANMAVSQVYALEGQCFVLASTSVVDKAVLEAMNLSPEQADLLHLGGGATTIFAPDGQPIGNQLEPDEEGLVIADIDLSFITLAKAAADPAGHYA
ncbi:MAG: carbon-nitrogen hydrolase family protein, partial [Pirellulales bacterium]|nr:carbon-nitrogen hydrolase family protein [Pirellulales bacterium]